MKKQFFFRFFSNETCVRLAGMCSYLRGLAILNVLWVNDAYKMDLIEKLRQLWQQSRFGILFAAQPHRHRRSTWYSHFLNCKSAQTDVLDTCKNTIFVVTDNLLVLWASNSRHLFSWPHSENQYNRVSCEYNLIFIIREEFVCACVCVSKRNNATLMKKFRHLYFFSSYFFFLRLCSHLLN